LGNHDLGKFLRVQCKEKNISLRSLSIQSGLSPATVHNIIQRKYQPTLFSLNRLADYLGFNRTYLWQLAGLIDGTDGDNDTSSDGLRLDYQFRQIAKLPPPSRNLVINIVETVLVCLKT